MSWWLAVLALFCVAWGIGLTVAVVVMAVVTLRERSSSSSDAADRLRAILKSHSQESHAGSDE